MSVTTLEKASLITIYEITHPFPPLVDMVIYHSHPLQEWNSDSPRCWEWWQLTTWVLSPLSKLPSAEENHLSRGSPCPVAKKYQGINIQYTCPSWSQFWKAISASELHMGSAEALYPSVPSCSHRCSLGEHSLRSFFHNSLHLRICFPGKQSATPLLFSFSPALLYSSANNLAHLNILHIGLHMFL